LLFLPLTSLRPSPLPGSVLFEPAHSFPCAGVPLFSIFFLAGVKPPCLIHEDTPFFFFCLPTTNSYTQRWGPCKQGFSKVEDPGQGLLRVRSEAPTLASDIRNVMQIHQGEHHRVEHG